MAAASPPFATSGATAASEDGNDSEGARGAAAAVGSVLQELWHFSFTSRGGSALRRLRPLTDKSIARRKGIYGSWGNLVT